MAVYKKFVLLLAIAAAGAEAGAASPLDLAYEPMEMETIRTEGTLVFSDSPEYVEQTGILAEGTISGKGRIYYYHVNSTGARARLAAYAVSDTHGSVTVTKFLQGIPSTDYITSGRSLSYSEMVSLRQEPFRVELSPGKRTVIAEEDPDGLLPGYLYTGLLEVETEGPVRFGMAMLPMTERENIEEALRAAEPLPADSHEMRGTFPMEVYQESRRVWDTDKDGPQVLTFGSSEENDFHMGIDELDQVQRENTGDYGMRFHFRIRTKGTRSYQVYLNPMGGVYMGAFRLTQGFLPHYYRTDDMKYRGRWFGDGTIDDYMPLGTWKPGTPIDIDFMPAGAAFLPVRFLFVPEGTL